MAKIEKMLKEGETEEEVQFSPSEIEQEWNKTKERTESKWMMGIYGREGTCKSGILMDLRTDEEIEKGTKIVIIDIDESCRPLWESYWNCDPNIRIFDPVVSIGKGTERDISYIASYRKVIAILGWLEEKIEEDPSIKYVAIDGIDTFLKWCEHVMKDVDCGNIDVHNSEVGYNWGKRNQRYYRVINWLKRLPVASFVTAHLDAREDIVTGEEKIGGPNWHNGVRQDTADELYQVVRTSKKINTRGSYKVKNFVAEVEKWKGDIKMESRKFKVLENKIDTSNNEAKAKWFGFIPKVRNYLDNGVEVEKVKPKTPEERKKKKASTSIIEEATGESQTDESTEKQEEEEKQEKSEEKEEKSEEQEDDEEDTEDTEEIPEQPEPVVEEEQEDEEEQEEEEEQEGSEEEDNDDGDWLDSF